MHEKQQKRSAFGLLGGGFMVASLPFFALQTDLTQMWFNGVSFVFFIGLIYALSGGLFAAVLLAALGGAWYWPAVNEWDMNVVTTVANTVAMVWVTAGLISLYRAWRYRKKTGRQGSEKRN